MVIMKNKQSTGIVGQADARDNQPVSQSSQPPLTERDLLRQRIEHLAWLLDSSIKVPFTRYTVGPEALIGLVPGVGDLIGGGLSAYLVWLARKHDAPWHLQGRMLGIAAWDFVVGLVPLVGDWLDFAHKSNAKIAKLLADHLAERGEESRV